MLRRSMTPAGLNAGMDTDLLRISRPVHGVIHYVISLVLVLAPWAEGFAQEKTAALVPVGVGVLGLLNSLCTDYEFGLIPLITFSAHLALDTAFGLLLAASPWMFGFDDRISTPHLMFGLLQVTSAVLTRNVPARTPGSHSR